MSARNVELTDHQARIVEQLAIPGCYQNTGEVLRDAAKVGIADIEAGNFHSFDSAELLGQHLVGLTSEVIGA